MQLQIRSIVNKASMNRKEFLSVIQDELFWDAETNTYKGAMCCAQHIN
jgi:hypothetical protein